MDTKYPLALLLILSSASALSWQEFCALPIIDKMLLQHENMLKIANGSVSNQYMTSAQASIWVQNENEMLSTFATAYPDEYARALANIKNITKSIIQQSVQPIVITKMIKVGDHYVSETICKAHPEECPAETVAPIVKAQVNYSRTPGECGKAREEDWQTLVWNYAGMEIDLANTNSANKESMLDQAAKGSQSKQYICLTGGKVS